ncbi:MAG: prepilin-type N-terminal cleavage/methylation domain-containing protein [Candidatus Zixiibacteriota bacterium]|nr:MAG: prepilin-type N-terminal cleavage/methylation domain-containing protein [candidate division Zixibacteria bacterium]
MSQNCHKQGGKLAQRGFTLVELVMIIVALGILAAVAIPKFTDVSESSKVTATKKEMLALKMAISGNPDAIAGGKYVDRGFEGDVGFAPSLLEDLAAKPDSVSDYNKLTGLGWNGPYIDSTEGKYLKDAWDTDYVYQPSNRRIISVGGSDSIIVGF